MKSQINLRDILISFQKNFIYFILIYSALFFVAYAIENFTGYKSATENIYMEHSIYPIEPIEEVRIKNILTLEFNNNIYSDPEKSTQKNLYTLDANKILNDFLVILYSKKLFNYIIENNNEIDKELLFNLQQNLSIEVINNPLSALVSINTERNQQIEKLFYILVSSAVSITQEKVINIIQTNINSGKSELELKVKNLEKLVKLKNEIESYNLLLETSKIFLNNYESIDFSFINSIDFLKSSIEPKKIIGLKRYSVNLTSLSILLSTIICLIILFIRTRKI